MLKIANSDQMREIDRQTIEEFHVPSLILMENAALRVVDILCDRFGPLRDKKIAIVCGAGNNGGDGLAIARHLSTRFNARVTVWMLANETHLKGEALAQYQIAQSYGLELKPASEIDLSQSDLIVDALFGTGIKGAVTGEPAKIIQCMNQSRKPVVAVDVPSGLDTDTGKAEGAVVHACLTVTFTLAKYGLIVYPGAEYAGEVIVADIGTPKAAITASNIKILMTDSSDVANWLPLRSNGRDVNKGTFGHVVVFAGSRGFAGAPVMVAEAAARTGGGLITLAIPEDMQTAIISRVSPVVMTRGFAQGGEGTFARAAVEPAIKLVESATAVAIGPGLGAGSEVASFARDFIAQCPVPLVIDADALNVLANEPDRGASIIRQRKAATILTPHPGEMARLLGIQTKVVQEDRRSAVMHATESYACVVLLKGARTLIASPEGSIYINTSGNAGMATGGTGDALTGVLAALLGQHLEPIHAAAVGAYIHGLAGDLAACQTGASCGLIATDLIAHLPMAIAQCQRNSLSNSRSIPSGTTGEKLEMFD